MAATETRVVDWTHGRIVAIERRHLSCMQHVESEFRGVAYPVDVLLHDRWLVQAGIEPHVGDSISIRWLEDPMPWVFGEIVIGEQRIFPPPDYPPPDYPPRVA